MDECIFCGKTGRMTKEHAIPKSIFSGGIFKENLITVPSCIDCNSLFAKKEEIFVHQLHLVAGIDKKIIFDKIQRRVKNPKLVRSNDKLKSSLQTRQLNGDNRLSVEIDTENSDDCILKMIKCLFYFRFHQNIVFQDYQILISRKNFSDLSEKQIIENQYFLNKFDWSSLEKLCAFDGYFEADFKKLEDNMNIFRLKFYDDIEFYVITF